MSLERVDRALQRRAFLFLPHDHTAAQRHPGAHAVRLDAVQLVTVGVAPHQVEARCRQRLPEIYVRHMLVEPEREPSLSVDMQHPVRTDAVVSQYRCHDESSKYADQYCFHHDARGATTEYSIPVVDI